jgi:hypothetical protein
MLKHKIVTNVLCHASGWCQMSKIAYDELKIRVHSDTTMNMSFRMDTTELKTNDEILQCLNHYNEKKFNFFYEKHGVEKYEVPQKFEYNVIDGNQCNMQQHGGPNVKKSFCDSLKRAHIDDITKITFTLYYNSDCKHLHQYINDWKRIKSLIEEYNYGSITTAEVIDKTFDKEVTLPILRMTECIYKIV